MDASPRGNRPAHGQLAYLQVPAVDLGASRSFYQAVFGWQADAEYSSFTAPGLIGQWTTDREPAASGGPLLWLAVGSLGAALQAVTAHGGTVVTSPYRDQGARWLAEVTDPAGNRLGLAAAARTAQSQTLLSVADVEASSRWYQDVLGLVSDHGGPEYERLLADGILVLQLHHRDVAHHHGRIPGGPAHEADGHPAGHGVLVWFGEVSDFDGAVARAQARGATVVRPPHRNPPDGEGPSHREVWLLDPDGYTVVIASPDGEAWGTSPPPA